MTSYALNLTVFSVIIMVMSCGRKVKSASLSRRLVDEATKSQSDLQPTRKRVKRTSGEVFTHLSSRRMDRRATRLLLHHFTSMVRKRHTNDRVTRCIENFQRRHGHRNMAQAIRRCTWVTFLFFSHHYFWYVKHCCRNKKRFLKYFLSASCLSSCDYLKKNDSKNFVK